MTTTYQQPGHFIWASTGTGETSDNPIELGEGLTGVLTIDADSDGWATVDAGPSVHNLNVSGVDDDGNAAVSWGDQIYIINTDTPRLSKKNSGNFFGFALGTVGTGATKDIDVLLVNSLGPGTADILAGVVGTSELAADAVTPAKISVLKDTTTGTAAGKILVSNGTEFEEMTVSGDVTLASDGSVTIGAGKVLGSMITGDAIDADKIADDGVSKEHLDDGIQPAYIVKFAGQHTPATGTTSATITVTGASPGVDIVIASLDTSGTGSPKFVDAGVVSDGVQYTLSSNPGALDSVITYAVYRATS